MPSFLRLFIAFVLALTFLGLAPISQAETKPTLKPGMWEFHSVSRGSAGAKTMDLKKCTDPWKDMQEMNLKLEKMGCQLAPTTQNGNVYHFSATCPLPNGKKATSVTDLTYQSESAYTAKIVSSAELASVAGATNEEITAKRTGDCQ